MTQRVLVTAGAIGIGLAIAKAFATDGARVHIADVNEKAVKDGDCGQQPDYWICGRRQ